MLNLPSLVCVMVCWLVGDNWDKPISRSHEKPQFLSIPPPLHLPPSFLLSNTPSQPHPLADSSLSLSLIESSWHLNKAYSFRHKNCSKSKVNNSKSHCIIIDIDVTYSDFVNSKLFCYFMKPSITVFRQTSSWLIQKIFVSLTFVYYAFIIIFVWAGSSCVDGGSGCRHLNSIQEIFISKQNTIN